MEDRQVSIRLEPEKVLQAIQRIKGAISIEGLLNEAIKCEEMSAFIYHHDAGFGVYDSGPAKTPFSYSLPPQLEADLNNPDVSQTILGVLTSVPIGETVWLSDMLKEDCVRGSKYEASIKRYLSIVGDGLLLSLFGPKGRKGQAFISFGRPKDAFDPLFKWQIQTLMQLLHVHYSQMTLKCQKQIKLTRRETDVLELITLGKTNPEIAIILNITKNTVNSYVKLIFAKLETSDRVTTAMRARTLQLVA